MSQQDADLFTRFSSLLWQGSPPVWSFPIVPAADELAKISGIQPCFADLVHLDSLGLIRFQAVPGFSIRLPPGHLACSYHQRQHTFSRQGGTPPTPAAEINIGCALLTDVGQQLAGVAGPSANEEYRSWVVSAYRKGEWEVVEG